MEVSPLEGAALALSAMFFVALALLVKIDALRRACPRFLGAAPAATPDPHDAAYNFQMALKIRRPRLNDDDAGLDEMDLALGDALVRVSVPFCRSSFSWAVESVAVDSEGGARSQQAHHSVESLATPLGGGGETRASMRASTSDPISSVPQAPAAGAASVFLKSDADGTVWLRWMGDPAPIFEVHASALHRTVLRAIPLSLLEVQRLAQERAHFLVALEYTRERALLEMGGADSPLVELAVPYLEFRLRPDAQLTFAPGSADFDGGRASSRPLGALSRALLACDRLLSEKGLPELTVGVEASISAADAASLGLARLRAAAVRQAVLAHIHTQIGERGATGPPADGSHASRLVTRAYGRRSWVRPGETSIRVRARAATSLATCDEPGDLRTPSKHRNARGPGADRQAA
ncbi:hypothetical protein KFE25_013119 [Diacronema lutheri]|uniref:OmpA-like domain-containing protein n=1 Tax=Diacronema lutheri TaxID=2081491 RepID=A0A8J5XAG3_DIALT|nr:hypothetical protein KFE25_013119 [Diacronema lutheri]